MQKRQTSEPCRVTPSRLDTGDEPGLATVAACAGVYPGLVPEGAVADPEEDFFANADLVARSLRRD